MKIYAILSATLLPLVCYASEFSYDHFSLGYIDGTTEPEAYKDLAAAYKLPWEKKMDIQGYQMEGKMELAPSFFGFLSYSNFDAENAQMEIDSQNLSAGIGAYVPLNDKLHLQYSAGYSQARLKVTSKYKDSDFASLEDEQNEELRENYENLKKQEFGYITANIGLQWKPRPWLEIQPSVTHHFGVKDESSLEVGGEAIPNNAEQYTDARLRVYLTALEMFQPYAGVSYNFQNDRSGDLKDLKYYEVGMNWNF